MRPTRLTLTGAMLASLLAAPLPAAQDALVLEHETVDCVVADRFPRLEARLRPAAAVARARAHFRPAGGAHWYSVPLRPEGDGFSALLPKPRPSLPALEYYLEATDAAMALQRTPEHTARVASGPGACQDSKTAGALGSGTVTLESPVGAPDVPVGFSAEGVALAVTAARSGETGGASRRILLIGGGVLAAGAAVAAAGGGSPDRQDTGPGVTPTPAPINLTGRWVGTSPDGLIVTANPQCALEGDLTLDLTQAANDIAGTATVVRRRNTDPFPICSQIGDEDTGPLTGSVSGSSVQLRWSQSSDEVFTLVGTVSGTRMSGTWSRSDTSTTGVWSVIRR